jgi:hypothetical protein
MNKSSTLALLLSIAPLAACGRDSAERVLAPDAQFSASSDSEWSEWSEPVHLGAVVNSASREIGPGLSPDGLSLYFGSDRPGGFGAIDMWVSRRACRDCPWEAPMNLGPNFNSPGGDGAPGFSPDGHLLFFSSARGGGHGREDIWVSHRTNTNDDFGWGPPVNLGPVVNSADDEGGPMYLPGRGEGGHHTLYFVRLGDIYEVAVTRGGETLGPAVPVAELNYPAAIDNDPTVRADGREIFFWSNRPGFGGADIWVATRRSPHDPWSTPQNLGPVINTPGADLTPALSRDGRTLVFSAGINARPSLGFQDLWMSTRTRR